MRHYKKGRKLGTDASHTAAIKKNLVVNIFLNDRIKTTLERAKEIRGDVDKIITWAKRGDVHSRRLAIAKLGDKELVAEIFSKVEQGLFKDRPGGYSRIYKVGKRRGDDAIIVLMELVQEPVQFKKKDAKSGEDEKRGLKVEKKASKAKKADEKEAEEAAVAEELDEAEDAVVEELDEAEEVAAEETVEETVEEADAEVAEGISEDTAEVAEETVETEEAAAEEAEASPEEAPEVEAEKAPEVEEAPEPEPEPEPETEEASEPEEAPAEDEPDK